ncbi:hypothetical protein bthur0009_48450 [Bacillus thuringiensis serovar andalousiensis BGSC 4AW1]|nr:hypothetical protein bthur0009_48450 [Bacillus thuringiensis serovar andalousiensis BGSC 4AW1]
MNDTKKGKLMDVFVTWSTWKGKTLIFILMNQKIQKQPNAFFRKLWLLFVFANLM